MIDFPRVRSDKGSPSPGPQPSSYALPKLFKLLCKEPGREEGNPNPGCLEFCQERITRQAAGRASVPSVRARPPCTCACACARCTALAPPYLGGSPAVLRARRRVQQIQRNLEDFGPRKMSVQRTHGPTNRPSERTGPLTCHPRERYLLPGRPLTRPAGLERGGLCNGLRPRVRGHT